MNHKRKLAAGALALLLALGATGCSNTTDTSWVYEKDGTRMPAGIYLNYMLDAYVEAESIYSELQATDDGSYVQSPRPADVRKATIEDKTGDAWILETAQSYAMQHYVVETMFDDLELSLSAADEGTVYQTLNSIWNASSSFYEKNGIAESSLDAYLNLQMKKETLFYALYGEGGEYAPSEAAVRDYYKENYVKFEYLPMTKSMSVVEDDPQVEADNAQLRVQAEDFLERLKNGDAVEDLVYEYRLSTATEDSGDSEDAGDGDDEGEEEKIERPADGSYTLVFNIADAANYGQLGEMAMAAADGEVVMEEDDYMFYLVRRLDVLEDQTELEYYRTSIVGLLEYENFQEQLKEWAKDVTVGTNQAAITRYTPDKLDFDYSKYAS